MTVTSRTFSWKDRLYWMAMVENKTLPFFCSVFWPGMHEALAKTIKAQMHMVAFKGNTIRVGRCRKQGHESVQIPPNPAAGACLVALARA